MNEAAQALARQLIRNLDDVPKSLDTRDPLYASHWARLAVGTAASKLGASIDILPPASAAAPTTCTMRRRKCS